MMQGTIGLRYFPGGHPIRNLRTLEKLSLVSVKNFTLSKHALLGWPGICAILVVILDHLTKFLVYHNWPIPGEDFLTVIPGVFALVHVRNHGAAWGMFSNHPSILGWLSLTAALVIVLFWKKITCKNPAYAMPFGFLLGGILGNMVDRLFFAEGVVDFLCLRFWPAFNVADSAISLAVIYLCIYEFFLRRKHPEK